MSLIERLDAKNPKRDFLFTAIEELIDPEDIITFHSEYLLWMWENNPEMRIPQERVVNVVNQNIGYVVGYYDKETADRWMNTLPDVSHPVFGREIPFGAGNPIKSYVVIFEARSKEALEAIASAFKEDFCDTKKASPNPLIDKLRGAFADKGYEVIEGAKLVKFSMSVQTDRNQQSPFSAFRLTLDGNKFGLEPNEIYVLLQGYVCGLGWRLEQQLGYKPEFLVEREYAKREEIEKYNV